MGWTIVDTGSWVEATTDNPATDMAAAMALPQSYRWHVHGLTALVRRDQAASLAAGSAGPPVSGYAAWYDASQITGHADGSTLAAWPDLSPNGHNLAQATPAHQPVYYSTTPAKLVNGKPAVWFDGVSQSMAAASFATPIAQPFTVVYVWAPGVVGGYIYPIDSTNALLGCDLGSFGVYAGAFLNNSQVIPTAGALHQIAGVFNGASSVVYVDGTPDTAGSPSTGNLADLSVGLGPHSQAAAGPIPEVIAYPFALTGPQVAGVYAYLKAKWGTP